MKKLIMVLTLVSILGACSSTSAGARDKMAIANLENSNWIDTAGEVDSENWWIASYEDQSE